MLFIKLLRLREATTYVYACIYIYIENTGKKRKRNRFIRRFPYSSLPFRGVQSVNFTTTHLFAHLIDRDPFLYLYRIPVSTTIPASLLRDSRNNNKIVQRYFFCTINIPSLFLTRSIEGTPFSPPLRSVDQRCTRAGQAPSAKIDPTPSIYLVDHPRWMKAGSFGPPSFADSRVQKIGGRWREEVRGERFWSMEKDLAAKGTRKGWRRRGGARRGEGSLEK